MNLGSFIVVSSLVHGYLSEEEWGITPSYAVLKDKDKNQTGLFPETQD
jgi:hypothetical protein